MAEPFIGELRQFGFDWPPRGWAKCDGALLSINENQALFSLLGTIYGGDGRTTFQLPDLRGRNGIHVGTGPGLSSRSIGQKFGNETTTLSVGNMPSHTHQLVAEGKAADTSRPAGKMLAVAGQDTIYVTPDSSTDQNMAAQSITSVGGGASFSNEPPTLVVNWCIALIGVYPSRN